MPIFQAVLVVLYSLMLWYEVRTCLAEYAAFKLLTETSERQKFYRLWLVRGILVFSGSALAGLTMLGRLHAMVSLPEEFGGVAKQLKTSLPYVRLSSGFLVGFGIAVCVGGVLGGVIAAKLADKRRPLVVGDVQSLMSRNWPETGYTFLLSLNAGLGEELLFRLFLPLLLALLSGNAVFAFLAAGAVFALMHVYQGALGILLTMFIGLLLALIYLATGSIWMAVAFHAGIDVLGLVVRPTVVRLLRTGRTDAAAEAR